MRFTKMQGLGNDYVYVDCFSEKTPDDPAALARVIADRHFGVGGDGLILICPSNVADARMRMFNGDGSESEMCGNGVRCVSKYVYDLLIAQNPTLQIDTGAGVLAIDLEIKDGKAQRARVDMGEPILDLPAIPVDAAKVQKIDARRYELQLDVDATGFEPIATFVSMGNPHATLYVADVKSIDLERFGPKLEHHAAFPKRINVHFVEVHTPGEVTMRTWERGSGITLACGTGASAVCVAGALTGRSARKILAHLPGGDLELEWDEASNHVYMTGPAVEVFSGEFDPAEK